MVLCLLTHSLSGVLTCLSLPQGPGLLSPYVPVSLSVSVDPVSTGLLKTWVLCRGSGAPPPALTPASGQCWFPLPSLASLPPRFDFKACSSVLRSLSPFLSPSAPRIFECQLTLLAALHADLNRTSALFRALRPGVNALAVVIRFARCFPLRLDSAWLLCRLLYY